MVKLKNFSTLVLFPLRWSQGGVGVGLAVVVGIDGVGGSRGGSIEVNSVVVGDGVGGCRGGSMEVDSVGIGGPVVVVNVGGPVGVGGPCVVNGVVGVG